MAPLWIQEEEHNDVVYHSDEYERDQYNFARKVLQQQSLSSSYRSVSFSEEDDEVREILPLDEYTPSEKRDCWYGEEEIFQIRREAARVVLLMNLSVPPPPRQEEEEESCAQGLECRTRAGRQRKMENRLSSMAAVFDAQETRWLFGGFDGNEGGFEEIVAAAYEERSTAARDSALRRASRYRRELEEAAKAEEARALRILVVAMDNAIASKKTMQPDDTTCVLTTTTTTTALFREENHRCRHETMEDRGDDDNNINDNTSGCGGEPSGNDGDSCLWRLRDRFACLLSSPCEHSLPPPPSPPLSLSGAFRRGLLAPIVV